MAGRTVVLDGGGPAKRIDWEARLGAAFRLGMSKLGDWRIDIGETQGDSKVEDAVIATRRWWAMTCYAAYNSVAGTWPWAGTTTGTYAERSGVIDFVERVSQTQIEPQFERFLADDTNRDAYKADSLAGAANIYTGVFKNTGDGAATEDFSNHTQQGGTVPQVGGSRVNLGTL